MSISSIDSSIGLSLALADTSSEDASARKERLSQALSGAKTFSQVFSNGKNSSPFDVIVDVNGDGLEGSYKTAFSAMANPASSDLSLILALGQGQDHSTLLKSLVLFLQNSGVSSSESNQILTLALMSSRYDEKGYFSPSVASIPNMFSASA